MTSSKIFSTLAGISGSVFICSFSNVQAKEIVDCHACHMKRLPKANELSLYEKEEDLVLKYDEKSNLPLSSEISIVRQNLCGLMSYFSGFKEEISHTYETGVAHMQSSYDYITSQENRIPRILAISSGGLLGYALARRRGIFKKLLYITTGSGIVCTAFYPTETKKYALIGWEHTKHHTADVLEKYGGYDTQKISNDAKEKVETIKSTLKLEGITNQMKVLFNEKIPNTLSVLKGSKTSSETTEENKTKIEKQ